MCVRMGRWAKGLGHVYVIKSRRLRSAPSSMSRCQRSERLPHASSPAPTSICQGRPNGQDSSASKGVGPHGHTSPAPARPQAKPNCHARELMPHRAVLTHPTTHVKIFYTRTNTHHMPSLMAISQAKLLCAPAMPNRAVNYITSHATAVNAVPDLTPRQHRIRCSPPLRTAMQLGVQMLASFIEPYAWPPTQGNSDHHQQCASLCEPPAEPSRHARQPCQPSC
jgi:hypothetical protein